MLSMFWRPPNECECNDCFRVIGGWYDLTFMTFVSVQGVMRILGDLIIEGSVLPVL